MFPGSIPVTAFKWYSNTRQTGCAQCGDDWAKHNVHMLEEKRQVNINLANCVAQFAESVFIDLDDAKTLDLSIQQFLNYSIDQELAQLRANPEPGPHFCDFAPEDLIRASNVLAKLERERDRYLSSIDEAPDEIKPMLRAASSIIFSMLDNQIDQAKEHVSMIQAVLEQAAAADEAAANEAGK